jgi:hypothetical protein
MFAWRDCVKPRRTSVRIAEIEPGIYRVQMRVLSTETLTFSSRGGEVFVG